MPDIKIFVSHRIDIASELIDNPLYVPVRCGAVFDRENPMAIAGDDTGDNISEKRMSFCELTVQYWAWKNAQADYYGLCHYRRYLSFSPVQYPVLDDGMVHAAAITKRTAEKYGLKDASGQRELISQNDIVIPEGSFVPDLTTPKGRKKTVEELWRAYAGQLFEWVAVDIMFQLIGEMSPQYLRAANEYFAGTTAWHCNCFVMERELFNRLCSFQFPILFEIERRLEQMHLLEEMPRIPAYIGEMLYGIFLYHITKYENWRVKTLQMVFFQSTERIGGALDLVGRYVQYGLDRCLRGIFDPLCPKGSARRDKIKKVYYSIANKKHIRKGT